MGMKTSAQVQIAKPAADVFAWLADPEKLTVWSGGPGLFPADPAELKSGFEASGPLPALAGEAHMRIENWNPPLGFGVTMTYEGGDSSTTYTLSESGGTTTLTCASDTDWGKPDLSAMEQQMADMAPDVREMMKGALDMMNQQVGAGTFDASTQAGMQTALEESLHKLKQLVEAE